jgi:hypothetical protein
MCVDIDRVARAGTLQEIGGPRTPREERKPSSALYSSALLRVYATEHDDIAYALRFALSDILCGLRIGELRSARKAVPGTFIILQPRLTQPIEHVVAAPIAFRLSLAATAKQVLAGERFQLRSGIRLQSVGDQTEHLVACRAAFIC